MPLINIKVLKEDNLRAEQKAELIARVTEAVAETLGKNPAATWVTIDEVSIENWGIGGETIAERRTKS